MADFINKSIGHYRITELIGQGGMANVYRATQTNIRREVVIKVMHEHFMSDDTFKRRFNREVDVIAQLQHPRILPVFDFGEQKGRPYIVMSYISGGSLSDYLKRHNGRLSTSDAHHFTEQIAEGVDYANQKGIIHRDLKPSNILLDENKNVYIADFGIAKVVDATTRLTGTGMIGTPAYMAPEMVDRGEATTLVDVYALGVILFQMLSGRRPYESETQMRILYAHVNKPIPNILEFRPNLPRSVQSVIESALAKEPDDRYQSCEQLLLGLDAALEGFEEAIQPEVVYEEPELEYQTPLDAPTIDVPKEPTPASEPLPEPEFEPEPYEEDIYEEDEVYLPPVELYEEPEPTPPAPAVQSTHRRVRIPIWIPVTLIVIVAGILGVLALNNVLTSESVPATATEEPIAAVDETPDALEPTGEQPVDTPVSVVEPTPTQEADQTSPDISYRLAETGVSSNDEWTPYTETFNGVEMALVPAGCFDMGSTVEDAMVICEQDRGAGNCDEDWFTNEEPVHEVCFEEPFWIDIYEVTNEQYGEASECLGYSYDDNQPRVCINWNDAAAYCESRGARLPTEAEWEYAARGPDSLIYPWGNDFVADNVVYNGDPGARTWDVGSKPGGVSWVGAYVLSGNVLEWVNDWYGSYSSGSVINPQGAENGSFKVFRGGSWNDDASFVRASSRGGYYPEIGMGVENGFRCALSFE
jgi:serine/threonine protein kinase/formylglycine-generating enzyme required for sulfatase activity